MTVMSARKIAYNTIAQVAGKFIGFFVSSFFLIILAGNLGTTGMGYYTTVTAFVAFFVNVADLGINTVMMRELAQNPDKRESITGDFLGFRIVLSVVIMALALPVAQLFPQYDSLIVTGVGVAALAQLFLLINQTFVSVLQVSLQLDRAVMGEIVNRIVTLALVVVAARMTNTMEAFFYAVLWITVIAALVNMGITYLFARKLWPVVPRFNTKRWTPILRMVIPMGVFSFLGMVHFKSDTVILSLLKPAHDVGIYGYAYKIGEIMFSIPMMFIGIVYPQMSALFRDNKPEFLNLTQKSFTVLLFVTLPFIAGIYALAPHLTTLLSRQSVADGLLAGDVLRVLTLAMFAWFFGALYQHILLAGSSYTGLIRNLAIAVVVNVGFNFFLIPEYSYYAAAWTTVITEFVMLILTVLYVQKTTDFRPNFSGIIPILTATAVMYGLVWLVQSYTMPVATFAIAPRLTQLLVLIGMGAVGGIGYFAILIAWGKASPLYLFIEMLRKKNG